MTAAEFSKALQTHAHQEDAAFLGRFFKTGEGQYGEGDVFIGVRVPQTRAVCKQFKDLPLPEIKKLLVSQVHEHRLAAVILLANQYAEADDSHKQEIFDAYMRAVYDGRVNNWDIVDSSAGLIVGEHLRERPRDILTTLANSASLWQKRVAMIATFQFLKYDDPSSTLDIAEILLHDSHDLIQKAVGWMLREMGKRVDRALLLDFLDKHAHDMPRTTLRYSIEHLPPAQKAHYMALKLSK